MFLTTSSAYLQTTSGTPQSAAPLKRFKDPALVNFQGLWIVNGEKVIYSQEVIFTFWCPMRFERFPLDSQTCKFQVNIFPELDL